MWTKGRGTSSVKPLVSSCSARIASRCRRVRATAPRRDLIAAARCPAAGFGQPARVDGAQYQGGHARTCPPFRLPRVSRADRETLNQHPSSRRRGSRETLKMWPGRFRIDVIWPDGRDAAPVVDACPHGQFQLVAAAKVRRRLDRHLRSERQAGDRDRPEVFAQRWFRCIGHRRTGLGTEVLNDDFLDVAMAPMDGPDSRAPRSAQPGSRRSQSAAPW